MCTEFDDTYSGIVCVTDMGNLMSLHVGKQTFTYVAV